jgi:hypothetical protein
MGVHSITFIIITFRAGMICLLYGPAEQSMMQTVPAPSSTVGPELSTYQPILRPSHQHVCLPTAPHRTVMHLTASTAFTIELCPPYSVLVYLIH